MSDIIKFWVFVIILLIVFTIMVGGPKLLNYLEDKKRLAAIKKLAEKNNI